MTTVFFIRHGLTAENREHRIQGQTPGTLLMNEAEAYVAKIIPHIKDKKPQLLLSSDLERAILTRDILKKQLDIPDISEGIMPLLREKAMGFYEGMLWSEVPEEFQEQRAKSNYDFRKFGGENNQDVLGRVKDTLRQVSQRYSNMRVVCVTHSGWLRQLVGFADSEGILPDSWTNRTAIYEAGLGPIGQLEYFHPIDLSQE